MGNSALSRGGLGASAAESATATPSASASPAPSPSSTYATKATGAQRERWGSLGYDRSYKADLLEHLAAAPQLVLLGGSRAQRFRPSLVTKLTGLSAFNFAAHNCRPADAFAISRYLFARAPTTRLRCIWAVEPSLLTDAPLDQALLYDKRFSQWLPAALRTHERRQEGAPERRHIPAADVYSSRGAILWNGYDRHRAAGVTLAASLRTYLARVLPRAAATAPGGESLGRFYLRKTLRLYNAHRVTPVLVIMPYQPRVLSAFRAVGWEAKLERFKGYLKRLHRRYQFRVLDCIEIGAFGGRPGWFYDGAHITVKNADVLLRYVVRRETAALQ